MPPSPVEPVRPRVLFTAFEPSGDDHASSVIREIRRRYPEMEVFAWGGPKMARAGAMIVQQTGDDAVVGVPKWDTIKKYRKIQKDIAAWIRANRPAVHVPVDSPAANFHICKQARRHGAKVVHLVAPQLWAWGPWRINKLRKRTDLVLCILPFEERWFNVRKVPAKFVGHPLFDEPLDMDALTDKARLLPDGKPKVAILPGSRPAELRRNFPLFLQAFRELRQRHPGMVGVVGATTEPVRAQLYEAANALGGWPEGMDIRVGETDLIARWCDLAIVVSGTVTLQLAKQARPMVIVYKTNELFYNLIGRWVISTKLLSLPNLIAGKQIVPELIPYFSGTERLVEEADRLIKDAAAQEQQRKSLRAITARFDGKIASAEAADAIAQTAGLRHRPHAVAPGVRADAQE